MISRVRVYVSFPARLKNYRPWSLWLLEAGGYFSPRASTTDAPLQFGRFKTMGGHELLSSGSMRRRRTTCAHSS